MYILIVLILIQLWALRFTRMPTYWLGSHRNYGTSGADAQTCDLYATYKSHRSVVVTDLSLSHTL